ncbi:D-2-hydroxyacid dehydrogenase [Paenibacillus cremeus]|uniref:D-2-hydroxyacid dehydrogenase n=1 Tax=Paenibacillus cremeus TaxID=2163881 RepID=A0A559KEL2_9BACL|nr:D-2-hydroxyacid dehydrogenase [Paenibacillus cremeus]TVY10562.1 D-2-hydroxyacid dehydrogenase [Paenibacillus cremeus]
MSRKIVVVHAVRPEHEAQIRRIAPEFELFHSKDKEALKSELRDAEIVAGWNSLAEAECFEPDAKLRWVQNWGAGVDRMPLHRFAERQVVLSNASGVHPNPISESVLAMMLALTRGVHRSIQNQGKRYWKPLNQLGEMHGKTVGIIGVGAIGTEIAKLCKAFDMRVIGVKRTAEPVANVDRMVTLEQLDEVLVESDYVVSTLPLTQETEQLFGAEQFARMKPTAYYINIGRGKTTHTKALIEALQKGELAGAGLDVFETEPLPESDPLWELDNVIITAHNSGSTQQYEDRAMEIFLHNLKDYVAGRTPSRNVVDLERQY